MVYSTTASGLAFYYLNEYVDVGTKISVLNAGYTAVPFEHVSNQATTTITTVGKQNYSGWREPENWSRCEDFISY